MKEYEENMKEYVKNTKKCVENMKEYEEICRYIGFGTLIFMWTLGLLTLYPGLGTWKNSTPELPSELWDIEKNSKSL